MLSTLSIAMIISSLAVFGLRNYKHAIYVYAFQTLLLVSIFFLLASTHDAEQLGTWAVVAFFTKVLFVPYVLLRLVKKVGVVQEDDPVAGFFVSPIIAIGFSLAIAMAIYGVIDVLNRNCVLEI